MDTFKVVEVANEPAPAWAIEWSKRGQAPIRISRTFSEAAIAQAWANRLAEIASSKRTK